MAAKNDCKLKEAKEHLKEAEKCMKTGLLKWKPDIEGASLEYGKAAIAFKNAKAINEAIECYIKQGQMEQQHGSLFQSARSYEAAGLMCKETQEWKRSAELIDNAANLYIEHGVSDTAVIMLNRGAKMLETALPEQAIVLYKKACDAAEGQDRLKECAESIGRAGRICIKLKRFDEAADYITKEIDYLFKANHLPLLNKIIMGLVLIHLHRDDYVAADQAFQKALRSYKGFGDSEEAPAIEQFLEAYMDRDKDKALRIVKGPLFAYMENDFSKLARDLKILEKIGDMNDQHSSQNKTEDEEEYGEDLL